MWLHQLFPTEQTPQQFCFLFKIIYLSLPCRGMFNYFYDSTREGINVLFCHVASVITDVNIECVPWQKAFDVSRAEWRHWVEAVKRREPWSTSTLFEYWCSSWILSEFEIWIFRKIKIISNKKLKLCCVYLKSILLSVKHHIVLMTQYEMKAIVLSHLCVFVSVYVCRSVDVNDVTSCHSLMIFGKEYWQGEHVTGGCINAQTFSLQEVISCQCMWHTKLVLLTESSQQLSSLFPLFVVNIG